mgnify:CR=1 FL=1
MGGSAGGWVSRWVVRKQVGGWVAMCSRSSRRHTGMACVCRDTRPEAHVPDPSPALLSPHNHIHSQCRFRLSPCVSPVLTVPMPKVTVHTRTRCPRAVRHVPSMCSLPHTTSPTTSPTTTPSSHTHTPHAHAPAPGGCTGPPPGRAWTADQTAPVGVGARAVGPVRRSTRGWSGGVGERRESGVACADTTCGANPCGVSTRKTP